MQQKAPCLDLPAIFGTKLFHADFLLKVFHAHIAARAGMFVRQCNLRVDSLPLTRFG
jgi:hypothetical protein